MHHRVPQYYRREAWKIAAVSALTIVLGTFAMVVRYQNRFPNTPVSVPEQFVQEEPVAAAHAAILYRTFVDSRWAVHAVNTDGSGDFVTAYLPPIATTIYWMETSHLLYSTGEKILLFDTEEQTEKIVIQAPSGHQIANLIISADRRWIAYQQSMSSRATQERGDPIGSGTSPRDCFDCGLAMTQDLSGVYIAKLDAFPATPKAVFPDELVPVFFDHTGHLYVRQTGQFSSQSPRYFQMLFTQDAPVITPFADGAVCQGAPVMSPHRNAFACTGVSGIYLFNLGSGDKKLLLPPSVATAPSLTTAYSYTRVLWNDDGYRLAAQAVPSGDTNADRQITVTIDPQREELTLLDPMKATAALDLVGYTADGAVFAIPSDTEVSAFSVQNTDTSTTIETGPAHFITTLPGIVPLQ